MDVFYVIKYSSFRNVLFIQIVSKSSQVADNKPDF